MEGEIENADFIVVFPYTLSHVTSGYTLQYNHAVSDGTHSYPVIRTMNMSMQCLRLLIYLVIINANSYPTSLEYKHGFKLIVDIRGEVTNAGRRDGQTDGQTRKDRASQPTDAVRLR